MKNLYSVAGTFALVAFVALAGITQQASRAEHPDLAKMKTLLGEWEGTSAKGQHGRTSYRMVSNGTVLQETITSEHDTDMITNYYLDGEKLMLTHFCAAGNQPRMVAAPHQDGDALTFTFKDVTNLASPGAGHMAGLTITFVDDNHFTQEWTWRENGKETKDLIRLTRTK